jgi:hypothetical protein
MPLDDDLRAALETMTSRPVNVGADLTSVRMTARRTRRRRITTTAISFAAAMAALTTTALVLQSHDSSKAHVSTPANTGAPPTMHTTTPTSLAPTVSTAPATTLALPSGAIAQDLTFTGTYSGHVTAATPANSGEVLGPHNGPDPNLPDACTNALPTQTGADGAVIGIVTTLQDQRLLLYYSVGDIQNPGSGLNEAVASIGTSTLTFDSSTVTVDQDRNGAQLDSDLYYYANGNRTVVGHITGHFRCGP